MIDEAKSGYDAAIKLTDKLARTIWSVYASLVATNAFLVALATFFAAQGSTREFAVRALGVLGLAICVAWYLITVRSFGYYGYFFAWARKFEEDAFGGHVQMIRLGEQFSKGGTVTIGQKELQLRWAGRLFKVEGLVNTVIATFSLIYLYVIFGLPSSAP